jgi:hypothetical protein
LNGNIQRVTREEQQVISQEFVSFKSHFVFHFHVEGKSEHDTVDLDVQREMRIVEGYTIMQARRKRAPK